MARIFISYKRADKERVFSLKDKIEKGLGEPCWIDLAGVESDAQFADVIIKNIDIAEVVLFMYSQQHSQIVDYENDWTIREINYAKEEHKRIVFVNLDNTPFKGWFKFMFPQKQIVDATSSSAVDKLIDDLKEWLNVEKPIVPPLPSKAVEPDVQRAFSLRDAFRSPGKTSPLGKMAAYGGGAFLLLCIFGCVWLESMISWRVPSTVYQFFDILISIYAVNILLLGLSLIHSKWWLTGLLPTIPLVIWDVCARGEEVYMHLYPRDWPKTAFSPLTEQSIIILVYLLFVAIMFRGMLVRTKS